MTRTGQLGCTITRKFVWGWEVANVSGTFRGTITTKNNGIVIRIDGDETRWPGTHKGAVRKLRRLAHREHSRLKRRVAEQAARDDAAIKSIAARTQSAVATLRG
ncbi:hypothetical protein KJ713_02970 [Patescibacteria group bacterium]|nr:hypothetical protein [Patescibacteria group bacterium]